MKTIELPWESVMGNLLHGKGHPEEDAHLGDSTTSLPSWPLGKLPFLFFSSHLSAFLFSMKITFTFSINLHHQLQTL